MDESHHRRRPFRLRGYDYSQPGAYFVTICAYQRECLFGVIKESEMQLNQVGRVVADCWQQIPQHFATVSLDEWIIMPNHLHGIIILSEVGARHASPLQRSASPLPRHGPPLRVIIGSFKSAAAKRINEIRATPAAPVWHRNYYEHVIRDERALDRIRQYIAGNPSRWDDDSENPERRGEACLAPTVTVR